MIQEKRAKYAPIDEDTLDIVGIMLSEQFENVLKANNDRIPIIPEKVADSSERKELDYSTHPVHRALKACLDYRSVLENIQELPAIIMKRFDERCAQIYRVAGIEREFNLRRPLE